MKKLFIVALLTITVAASSFAKDNNKVNAIAANNFKAEFANATAVSWTATDNYYKATFTVNDEKMEAFYNPQGEKVATSRTISIDQLPVKAKRSFAKDFAGYTIKEAIEFEGTEEPGYYIAAESEKESVILKICLLYTSPSPRDS